MDGLIAGYNVMTIRHAVHNICYYEICSCLWLFESDIDTKQIWNKLLRYSTIGFVVYIKKNMFFNLYHGLHRQLFMRSYSRLPTLANWIKNSNDACHVFQDSGESKPDSVNGIKNSLV